MENEDQKLHPSVVSFKQFVNKYPLLLREIRKSGRTWQEYYEKWVLLGEEDPYWDQFKEKDDQTTRQSRAKSKDKAEEKNFELMSQLMKLTENIDMNKIQNQVSNLNKTIASVQELVDQFQHPPHQNAQHSRPFNWFRD
ncbi:YlbD family protein [Oceanobacillus salinisoli]|uniref:YlbD family protein n=1 Tax=Oceanobacillus salinisoli TaxID=2678611 RepID=UPI0012E1C7B5|nr:YlbD family protein [Oceanobacillus salinisoli]